MMNKILIELKKLSTKERLATTLRFFKTGKDSYSENDVFIGNKMSDIRKVVKENDLDIKEWSKLLLDKHHEVRMASIIALLNKYQKAIKSNDDKTKKEIFDYLNKNISGINNWDLVDTISHKVFAWYLEEYYSNKEIVVYLEKLYKSSDIWLQRISIITNKYFINKGEFKYFWPIIEYLKYDKQDLTHKALGWMLREVGNFDLKAECKFLDKYYKTLPRTLLRYSIEKFPKDLKDKYMGKKTKS